MKKRPSRRRDHAAFPSQGTQSDLTVIPHSKTVLAQAAVWPASGAAVRGAGIHLDQGTERNGAPCLSGKPTETQYFDA